MKRYKFNIKSICEERNITADKIANFTGLDALEVQKIIENKKDVISLHEISFLCKFFNCELTDLFTEEGEQEKGYGSSKETFYKGMRFKSRKELYKFLIYGLDKSQVIEYSVFCARLKEGLPLERLIVDKKKTRKGTPVFYQGKEYDNLKRLYLSIRRKNQNFISYPQVNRLLKEGMTMEEIMERYKHRLNNIERVR